MWNPWIIREFLTLLSLHLLDNRLAAFTMPVAILIIFVFVCKSYTSCNGFCLVFCYGTSTDGVNRAVGILQAGIRCYRLLRVSTVVRVLSAECKEGIAILAVFQNIAQARNVPQQQLRASTWCYNPTNQPTTTATVMVIQL